MDLLTLELPPSAPQVYWGTTLFFKSLVSSSSLSAMLMERTSLASVLDRNDEVQFKWKVCYSNDKIYPHLNKVPSQREEEEKCIFKCSDESSEPCILIVRELQFIEQPLCARHCGKNFIRLQLVIPVVFTEIAIGKRRTYYNMAWW